MIKFSVLPSISSAIKCSRMENINFRKGTMVSESFSIHIVAFFCNIDLQNPQAKGLEDYQYSKKCFESFSNGLVFINLDSLFIR